MAYAGGVPDNLSYNEALSGDGRYATCSSDATNLVRGDSNGSTDVFLRDRTAGTTERISVNSSEVEANGSSAGSAVSDDGRWFVFMSLASDLVPNDNNGVRDVFIHDLGVVPAP